MPPTKQGAAVETHTAGKEKARFMTMNETQFIRSIKHESFRITMEQRQKEWAIRQKENFGRFRARVCKDGLSGVFRSEENDDQGKRV